MKFSIDLVEKAKNGDKSAFGKLYDEVATDLYKMAVYTLGNTYDAEDIVSETFIEAYKGIKNLRDDNSFKPWIMRILYIRCKRKISQYIKDKPNMDIEEILDLTDEKINLEEDISEKTALAQALNTLNEDERTIIILSAINGYTTKEISKILDTPHGTISSKLHRTYIKLRKLLEKS